MIVDDEPNAVKLLEDHIAKAPFLSLRQKCFDAFEAIAFLEKEAVDLIFLDINMPQLSGMELAAALPGSQRIIMTTAYAAHALESYEYNVVDYLLKPITFKRFMQAVYKAQVMQWPSAAAALPQDSGRRDYFFVRSGKQILKMEYGSIRYFEALKEYVNVITTVGPVLIYKRMKQLQAELPPPFIRIHNSYIINISHLQKIADNQVLIGDARLPVSASYREPLLRLIEKDLL